jgi:hypothetical protein
VLALLLACSGPSEPAATLSEDTDQALQVFAELDHRRLPADQASITHAEVSGRTLRLTLRFGGGCKRHRFALVAIGPLGESLPPSGLLRLAHDGNADPCDALLQRELEIDLSPIIPLVHQAGGTALRFQVLEPGGAGSAIGELVVQF